MKETTPLEIERKFIIKMPSEAFLASGVTWHIEQTYLVPSCEGETRRVRRSECRGQVIYTMTSKRRKNDIACYEDEAVLDKPSYYAMKMLETPDCETVVKTRHVVPYMGHLLEVDVYPFWQDYAILEVELNAEDEAFELPKDIIVVREVTSDHRYKNVQIARYLRAHPGTPIPVE